MRQTTDTTAKSEKGPPPVRGVRLGRLESPRDLARALKRLAQATIDHRLDPKRCNAATTALSGVASMLELQLAQRAIEAAERLQNQPQARQLLALPVVVDVVAQADAKPDFT